MCSARNDLDYYFNCHFSTIILIVTFQLNTSTLVCKTLKGEYSRRLVSNTILKNYSLTPVSKFCPGWLTEDTHQILGVEISAQLLRCPKQCLPEAKMFSNKGLIRFKEITEKRPTKKKRKKKAYSGGGGGNGEPIFNLQVLF